MVLERVAAGSTAGAAPRSRTPAPDAVRSWVDRALRVVPWTHEHERLAAQPLLAGCGRAEIRHLARVGDQCIAPAGAVLCRQGGIGYWFFLVMVGRVTLSRDGRVFATVGAGEHLGAVAILGFGPQADTATVAEDSVVYVLGRRHLLDLCHSMPALRTGLFPGVSYEDFLATVRSLRDDGLEEWRAIQRAAPRSRPAAPEALPAGLRVLPPRGPAPGPVFDGIGSAVAGAGDRARRAAVPVPLGRRTIAVLVAGFAAMAAILGFGYHPGIRVARPSAVIDITGDVSVEGVPVRPPAGRYILTAVDITEPHLVGVAHAYLTRQQILPRLDPSSWDDDAARREYLDSQQRAARLLAARAGVDPAAVVVRFRNRDVTGPSAGLVYALLLADMRREVDVPAGRVIAATGVVADDGRIGDVGFVSLKRRVAERADADLFLVPVTTEAAEVNRRRHPQVAPVASFDDALRAAADPQRATSTTTMR